MSDSKSPRWWRSPQMLLRQILMLDDTPHSIALGTTIGMFIGLTPTVGIQMAIVMLVAVMTGWLFRFNRVAALITVYISNPVTTLPMYWFNYQVGTLFVEGNATYDDLRNALSPSETQSWWQALVDLAVAVGWPLIVGSMVVATIGAVVTYPTMLWLIRWFHNRRPPMARAEEPRETVGAGIG